MPLDDTDKITHLLRRAGFAARPEEIAQGMARGLPATVETLLNFQNVSDNLLPLPNSARYNQSYLDLTFDEYISAYGDLLGDMNRIWLHAMMVTTRPLQEKMVLFWHGLFATSAADLDLRQMYLQNQLLRGNFNPDRGVTSPSPFPLGDFRLMLEWLTKDPAMLFFLDNWTNTRLNNEVGSNENYARELHELFSMGVEDVVAKVPNYTERDVRQASRALTGWSVAPWVDGQIGNSFPRWFAYQPTLYRVRIQHDPGPYDHLGVTFRSTDGRLAQLFQNIVAHKNQGQQQSATGRFLSYRLFSFFGYDDPEPEIINALADVFDGAGGQQPYLIRNMLRTMFMPGNAVSEAFYSERAFTAHVKSPTEYVVSTFRLLKPEGLTRSAQILRFLIPAMSDMGQYLFFPPDVSGWKEGLNWINTTFDLARFNFGSALLSLGATQGGITTDSLRALLNQNGAQTPEQVVDYFTNLMLQVQVSPETRANLVNYLRAGTDGAPGGFNFDLSSNATIDNKVRGLIHLIMTTPEFQLS